ncbi:MAG TPA: M28 family peptidase [Planctomycetes bacterium]|nr:M28 family peptidase [Planctomycetota bacterium]
MSQSARPRLLVPLLLAGTFWLSPASRCPFASAGDRNGSLALALESIHTEELREHVEYLAHDKLEGREAGSRGGRLAARYLAAQLARTGLEPAGVDGGFFQPFPPNYRNVLAMLKGSDPVLRNQYIVVGAHYDHVGYGTSSNSRGPVGHVHNGADDNASGVSGLIELAEAFAMLAQPPRRSVLFVGWDAEEKGTLGSLHWRNHPTVPLGRVVFSVNMDMIGWLRDELVTVYGSRSGYGLRRLTSLANQQEHLRLAFDWTTKHNSDHYVFLEADIPTLLFHTGLHPYYHTPYDDAQRINVAGMRRVVRLVLSVIYAVADHPEAPRFRAAWRNERQPARATGRSDRRNRPRRLGVTWDARDDQSFGIRVRRVAPGSPAQKAGIKPGDRIVRVDGRPVRSGSDLVGAVAMAGKRVDIEVERKGHKVAKLQARLGGKPLRLGIRWRVDEAEPQAVILTDVIPGTPAARAGLQVGDRIYRIGGVDFTNQQEFAQLARSLPMPLTLLVERDGQLRTVQLQAAGQSRRAA